jgi:hypothetical protein
MLSPQRFGFALAIITRRVADQDGPVEIQYFLNVATVNLFFVL